MLVSRRLVCACAQSLALTACATSPAPAGPLLWRVSKGAGEAYILGVAEADGRAWLTPQIARALAESRELWVETPPPGSAPSDPVLLEKLGYDRAGDLFTFLGPKLAGPTLALTTEAGLTRERVAPMRPWLAYYVINTARLQKRPADPDADFPQAVLIDMARAKGKPIYSEYATADDLNRFFAGMPDDAQRQYIQNLLDYIDLQKRGLAKVGKDWAVGRPHERFIHMMRTRTPALYLEMHIKRNAQWARRIEGLLNQGGSYFILLGLNHTLGPHSVQRELSRIGLPPRLAT